MRPRTSTASCRRPFNSSSVRCRSPATASSSSWRCAIVSESALRAVAQTFQFGGGRLLLFLHARGFALDARQILVHLRELVAQRGDFAQQPQHRRAALLDGLLALADGGLQFLAQAVLFQHARARFADLPVERGHLLLVRVQVGGDAPQPHFQLLRFPLRLRDALLDGAALLHLRFQAAARALGFHLAFGQFAPRFGELLLILVGTAPAVRVCACSLAATCSESPRRSAEARFRSSAALAASRSSMRNLPESATRRRASISVLSSP